MISSKESGSLILLRLSGMGFNVLDSGSPVKVARPDQRRDVWLWGGLNDNAGGWLACAWFARKSRVRSTVVL
jgi:hypothetical protein